MNAYEAPRVTFVGSDPKIPALMKAAKRVAENSTRSLESLEYTYHVHRFATLHKARNRRTRVLMNRVQKASGHAR